MLSDAPGALFPTTAGALAELLGASLQGAADVRITGLNSVGDAIAGDVTFLRSAKLIHQWAASKASAVIVSEGVCVEHTDTQAVLTVPDADLAIIEILRKIAPTDAAPAGVHASAVVHATATIDPSATIGPTCVIGAHARVGSGTVLHANVIVERNSIIGDNCTFHPGVVIGSDGFGYHFDPTTQSLVKVPHAGNVVIGNNVEIGANSCIDRAKFGSTRIGNNTKIDNLVQIAHNVVIGETCIICGNAGVAGSTRIGNGVTIGGSVGIMDNLTIGDGVSIAGFAGVMHDIPAGESWFGLPASNARANYRRHVAVGFVTEHIAALRAMLEN